MNDVATSDYDSLVYAADRVTKVATITLNRPGRLNALDRHMCEELADVWARIREDEDINAVVLRAAGRQAFSTGLDASEGVGRSADVQHHQDLGECLSAKRQELWKPVVCAVQGVCSAEALSFINDADVVICSEDATFFDSRVSFGLVCAVEPIGLMRRVGLGETMRIALAGNDERVTAATALRIGLVTEVVPRDALWDRANDIARGIAAKPSAATQGTVRAIWESLDKPYRVAMEQGLAYTRISDSVGLAQGERTGTKPTQPRLR